MFAGRSNLKCSQFYSMESRVRSKLVTDVCREGRDVALPSLGLAHTFFFNSVTMKWIGWRTLAMGRYSLSMNCSCGSPGRRLHLVDDTVFETYGPMSTRR